MSAPTTPRPTAAQAPGGAATRTPGLRERKKRLMRAQLSDVAAGMFLERGFDGVRVAEVAEACGVSEKTVFNYFPTKESMLFDRSESGINAVADAVRERGSVPLVDAVVQALAGKFALDFEPAAALIHRTGLYVDEGGSVTPL